MIAGGGLAGCLAALALAERRPDLELLLIEHGQRFGGNHIWSYFDDDVAAADRWLVDPFVAARWDGYEVRFPKRSRSLPTGYNSARAPLLDRAVRDRLRPDQYRLGAKIDEIGPTGVLLESGERIEARAVVDARGAPDFEALRLGWQAFAGREFLLCEPHGLSRPTVMDASVDQVDGYRFVYTLPFSADRLLVEDTYYVLGPIPDRATMVSRIEAYLGDRGWSPAAVEGEEAGVLPVVTGGDFDRFWPPDAPVGRLGLRGGFFHPTTGYSLPDAVRTALLLASFADLDSEAIAGRLRTEALRLWRERRFYRLLNRMLFHAAEPSERYRILEHFYRLDPVLVARFYSGRLRWRDKLHILSGRPPVAIGRALAALWK